MRLINASAVLSISFLLLLPAVIFAALHPDVFAHDVSHTVDVGFGNSLYLVGDVDELGAGDSAAGVKMRYTDGNVWRASVSVRDQEGRRGYRFVSRSTSSSQICLSENARDVASGFSFPATELSEAPYDGKTVSYFSRWERVFVRFRSGPQTAFVDYELQRAGSGREEGEFLYRIAGIGDAGELLEFVFFNGEGQWDNAFDQPGTNYESPLDFVHVQDGHVFNYMPAALVSDWRIETRTVQSTANGIPARTVHIYLPRGYDDHPVRRYPVVYFHDGQNVFAPGGAFGSWDADLTTSAAIQMGRIRECILVAIDNTDARLSEYLPPTDDFNGLGSGDAYADFLINNVRPTIDSNYRTQNDSANTTVIGSSFGGIITIYLGWEHDDVFGKLGVFSPASWAIPNLRTAMRDEAQRSERVYLYWGTAESSVSADEAAWWSPFLDQYDIYLSQGYSVQGDLLARVGCGEVHNESAWATYLPDALEFLLNINDEANELAHARLPPRLEPRVSDDRASLILESTLLSGYTYELQRTATLGQENDWVSTLEIATSKLWEVVEVEQVIPDSSTNGFFRLVVTD